MSFELPPEAVRVFGCSMEKGIVQFREQSTERNLYTVPNGASLVFIWKPNYCHPVFLDDN